MIALPVYLIGRQVYYLKPAPKAVEENIRPFPSYPRRP